MSTVHEVKLFDRWSFDDVTIDMSASRDRRVSSNTSPALEDRTERMFKPSLPINLHRGYDHDYHLEKFSMKYIRRGNLILAELAAARARTFTCHDAILRKVAMQYLRQHQLDDAERIASIAKTDGCRDAIMRKVVAMRYFFSPSGNERMSTTPSPTLNRTERTFTPSDIDRDRYRKTHKRSATY